MSGNARTPARAGRRRRMAIVLACGLGALAVLGATAWSCRDTAKVWYYHARILRGENPQGNLDALAAIDCVAARRILERYALRPHPGLAVNQALFRLCGHFPDSPIPRGIAEWKDIVGHYYFDAFALYDLERREPLSEEAAGRLETWLRRYRVHPGRDDACLLLGVRLEREAPIDALQYLWRAHREPDGDKRTLIANWFQRVLERHLDAGEILGWAERTAPPEVLDNLYYVAALKTMRRGRYTKALALFERSVAARDRGLLRMRGDWPGRARRYLREVRHDERMRAVGRDPSPAVETTVERIDEQIAACRELAANEQALAEADDDEARASILHEMGRRAFHEEELFTNLLYRRLVLGAEAESKQELGLDDIHPGDHYRRAAEIFRVVVERYPGYSRIEDVAYSIPLCLWRLRCGWPFTLRKRLDRAIVEGFQAFADRYPSSRYADDALWTAGCIDWLEGDERDPTLIQSNMLRIAREHPDGDVVAKHGTRSSWLSVALREVRAVREVRGALEESEGGGEGAPAEPSTATSAEQATAAAATDTPGEGEGDAPDSAEKARSAETAETAEGGRPPTSPAPLDGSVAALPAVRP